MDDYIYLNKLGFRLSPNKEKKNFFKTTTKKSSQDVSEDV